MAPLADRIVETLKVQARALDDDELAAYLGVVRQAVNQACRGLERKGIVERYVGPTNKIVSRLPSSETLVGVAAPPASAAARPHDRRLLSEDEAKEAVKAHLEAQGFRGHCRLGAYPRGRHRGHATKLSSGARSQG